MAIGCHPPHAGNGRLVAPRSIWNGTIAFGLVNVPITLYSPVESKRSTSRGQRVLNFSGEKP
jgi:hypothetical protein